MQLVSVGPQGVDDDANGWRAPLSQYPAYAAALAEGKPWIIASPKRSPAVGLRDRLVPTPGRNNTSSIRSIVDGNAIAVIDIDVRERDFAEHLDFARNVANCWPAPS